MSPTGNTRFQKAYKRTLYLIVFVLISLHIGQAQTILNEFVSGQYENKLLPDVFTDLEDRYDVRLLYDSDKISMYPITLEFENIEMYKALRLILKGGTLTPVRYKDNIIVILPRAGVSTENAARIVKGWEEGRFKSPTAARSQEMSVVIGDSLKTKKGPFEVIGRITDKDSEEPIIGATLALADLSNGTATDFNGGFRLNLPRGNNEISIQYSGYQDIDLDLGMYEDGKLNIEMEVQPYSLTEVLVTAESAETEIQSANIGVETLDLKKLKSLPSFMGEADVIKGLEVLPGVSTVGDGATGFNVRGGSIDQNLVMIDGATIFNSSHALGFFSIFNADAVKRVSLYKGNIPANYGGRLSSVLEVEMKDGDFEKWNGNGGIGLASAKVTVDGPIAKNKTSVVLSGRTSYSNWMLRDVRDLDVRESSAKFHDWSLRLTHKFSPSTTLVASSFRSSDFFRYAQEFGYSWTTDIQQLNVRHFISERWSAAISGIYGVYKSQLFDPLGTDAFDFDNGIRYVKVKPYFIFQPNEKHSVRAGVDYTYYDSYPEEIGPRGNLSAVEAQTVEQEQASDLSFYVNDEIVLNKVLSFSLGVRYTVFNQLGPGRSFSYDDSIPLRPDNATGSTDFGDFESIQQYSGIEPRASMKIGLGENRSLKLSYNRLRQYIHLISNSAAATPADVWQLSTTYIPPQTSDNYSIGYFQNFADGEWITSLEAYYKSSKDILTYKNFPQLLLNEQLETELLQAKGRAFGVELSIQRTLGKLSGRLAYSFSRSMIKTESEFFEETINNGDWFPSDFDQPHQLSLALRWQMNPITTMNFNFTFRSGRPISAPTSSYEIEQVIVSNFSPRNQFRIPAYHRFDWSLAVDGSRNKRKGYRSSFTLSLYNFYGRRNAFSLYFQRRDAGVLQAYRLSVLGTVFPSLSYNFTF